MAPNMVTALAGLLTQYTDPVSQQLVVNNQWAISGVDAAGNVYLPVTNGYPADLAYDGENRMVSGKTGPSATMSAEYDGEVHRVKRTVNNVTTVYVYDAMGGLAQEYGGGSTTSGRQYLVPDHLGSTRLMMSNGGTVQSRTDYYPFGQEIEADATYRTAGLGYQSKPAADADWQRVRFTGKERDSETGLDYSIARYFSSAQGRFTSPDPDNLGAIKSDPQSWNAYAYVRNNPLKFTDPLGLNYTVCNAEGKECKDLTDQQYEKYLASIQNTNIYVTPGGTINYQNENGSVTRLGTATYYNEKNVERVEAAQAFLNYFMLESAKNAVFQVGARALFAAGSYGYRLYRASRAGENAIASTPVGRAGTASNAAGNNGEQVIGGRLFSGHALDRMQERRFTPSVVEDIIANGTRTPGRYPGTTEVVGQSGRVIVGGKMFGVFGAEKVIAVIPK